MDFDHDTYAKAMNKQKDINRHPVTGEPEQGITYVYVGDLQEDGYGEFLFCPECGGEWSANRRDYFWKPEDEPFVCADDNDEPLRLAYRETMIRVSYGEEIKDLIYEG